MGDRYRGVRLYIECYKVCILPEENVGNMLCIECIHVSSINMLKKRTDKYLISVIEYLLWSLDKTKASTAIRRVAWMATLLNLAKQLQTKL